jgi:hypothetical protein
LVYFIGDKSHAELPDSKIEKFDLKYSEFSKTRQRSLINSINIAEGINRGSDGVLKEIDRKNLNYNFNFQFNSKKNMKQLSKQFSAASTALSNSSCANTDNAQVPGGSGALPHSDRISVDCQVKRKERKGSGDKCRNSFVNSNNSNNSGNLNNNTNNIKNAYDASCIGDMQVNNSINNINSNFGNSFDDMIMDNKNKNEHLLKSFSGNSLLNLANFNNSLDSIISLNDTQLSVNMTLGLNEASSGNLGNANNAKNKLNLNNKVINPNMLSDNNVNYNNYNYLKKRMDALNDRSRKNSSNNFNGNCNKGFANAKNKDKLQKRALIDLYKKMSFCSNGSEAASKNAKSSLNNLDLMKCLKQKEVEIMKAQKIRESKTEEKMLSSY